MLVQRIARQGALRLNGLRALGKNGDAVKRFLPVPNCPITRAFEVRDGKALILRLHFLQTGNIGLGFLQPFKQSGKARFDAVNVVSCDTHVAALAGARYRIKPKSLIHNRNRLALAGWSP